MVILPNLMALQSQIRFQHTPPIAKDVVISHLGFPIDVKDSIKHTFALKEFVEFVTNKSLAQPKNAQLALYADLMVEDYDKLLEVTEDLLETLDLEPGLLQIIMEKVHNKTESISCQNVPIGSKMVNGSFMIGCRGAVNENGL